MMQSNKLMEFISILRCPNTERPLERMTQTEVDDLNAKIKNGEVFQCDGTQPQTTYEAVLKVKNRDLYYPIVDDIYCLLPNLVLVGKTESNTKLNAQMDAAKQQLQDFYNEVGWQKDESHFVDAVDSEDLRGVSEEYRNRCHDRVKRHLHPSGKYLLDVASGPIQYDAYLRYSEDYQYRVCADISLKGLKEAQKKLKDRGLYVLCDMTHLPFDSNALDGIVSLHTIYHIPKDQQLKAFSEIYRVLQPGRSMVVVYSWGNRSLFMNMALFPWKLVNLLKRLAPKRGSATNGDIYFYAHGYGWYLNELKSRFPVTLKPWRSANVPFLKRFIHRPLLGRWVLKFLFTLEERFPDLMGRHGAYPMLVFEKGRVNASYGV